MTANPDSALRQALDALAPFVERANYFDRVLMANGGQWPDDHTYADDPSPNTRAEESIWIGDLRRAREAHALITEALQGFPPPHPKAWPSEFVRFFCDANSCAADAIITRIEFHRIDPERRAPSLSPDSHR